MSGNNSLNSSCVDNNSDKENGSRRAVWTDGDDEIMLRVLREQKIAGNQSDSGWKKVVWTAVLAALMKESHSKGARKSVEKCIDHWTNVRPPNWVSWILLY